MTDNPVTTTAADQPTPAAAIPYEGTDDDDLDADDGTVPPDPRSKP